MINRRKQSNKYSFLWKNRITADSAFSLFKDNLVVAVASIEKGVNLTHGCTWLYQEK